LRKPETEFVHLHTVGESSKCHVCTALSRSHYDHNSGFSMYVIGPRRVRIQTAFGHRLFLRNLCLGADFFRQYTNASNQRSSASLRWQRCAVKGVNHNSNERSRCRDALVLDGFNWVQFFHGCVGPWTRTPGTDDSIRVCLGSPTKLGMATLEISQFWIRAAIGVLHIALTVSSWPAAS
jgi:hypothetical protein